MTERIHQIHQGSYDSYGMPRIRAELIEQGVCISRQRVARLMRQAGIHGISKRRGFTVTTRRDKHQTPANDLVNRRFHATGPNQLLVADMTYVPTWMGFLYLALVIDVWSRRVVGWAMGERMTADLVLAALNMALEQRKPNGVIHHSDPEADLRPVSPNCQSMLHRTKEVISLEELIGLLKRRFHKGFNALDQTEHLRLTSGGFTPPPSWRSTFSAE